jgi:hypothetical protein
MLVEESVLGFSFRCLRPGVFEFQLGASSRSAVSKTCSWPLPRDYAASLGSVLLHERFVGSKHCNAHAIREKAEMHEHFEERVRSSLRIAGCGVTFGEDNFAVARGRPDLGDHETCPQRHT